ncbi:MAG: hypothetical protein HDQ88_02290 [Clostridia bacterium]|nr:hypothetical protein [Clostridia bacterium]
MSGGRKLTNAYLKEKMTDTMHHLGTAADADLLRGMGCYATASNTLNIPPGFSNGVLEVIPRNSVEVFQRVTAWQGLKVAVRTGGSTTWNPWRIYEPTGTA